MQEAKLSWRNWQPRGIQVAVPKGVWVRVPPRAPDEDVQSPRGEIGKRNGLKIRTAVGSSPTAGTRRSEADQENHRNDQRLRDGIGRRSALRRQSPSGHAGSSPAVGTKKHARVA